MTPTSDAPHPGSLHQVTVPAIGDFSDVPVIEVHVAEGDMVAENDPLVTLESDKATMDVPAPAAGTVQQLHVKLGDRVNVGSLLLSLLSTDGSLPTDDAAAQADSDIDQQEPGPEVVADAAAAAATSATHAAGTPSAAAADTGTHTGTGTVTGADRPDSQDPHAGPGVRRLARELGLDLATVNGTGRKGRVVKEDLLAALTPATATPAPSTATRGFEAIPAIPEQDFAVFGPVQVQPLPRITRLSGPFLHRSWLNVPHVTHNDDADITALDAYRRELDAEAQKRGERVTLLSFLLKASAATLHDYPQVNSSLTAEKDALVLKSYFHIGVAVDTPGGLVVPVIRDVDHKGITQLSRELADVSACARDGKLTAEQMQGGTFTISSLGGIGGTSFTPIVNAPEVAILGVVRAVTKPVWNGRKFKPRLLLPLSLSYDHRVIDGALAARFTRSLCHRLEDPRRLLL